MELDIALSQERIQQLTTSAVAHANAALIELRRLFLVEDLVDSIKFGVLLYCLTYVGAIFNGMTLIILGKQKLLINNEIYLFTEVIFSLQASLVSSLCQRYMKQTRQLSMLNLTLCEERSQKLLTSKY